jgi:hypothetical protein
MSTKLDIYEFNSTAQSISQPDSVEPCKKLGTPISIYVGDARKVGDTLYPPVRG